MPAAEPAHPAGAADGRGPAAVIQMSTKRRRQFQRPAPAGDPSPEELLAETIEAVFHRGGHTLTDDQTAAHYLTTLKVVGDMLDGVFGQHLSEEDQRRQIQSMLEGMRRAHDILS